MEKLVQNHCVFGTVYAASNKDTTIFILISVFIICAKSYRKYNVVEFKDFSRLLSDFPALFKADLVFKDFQESPLNSSTFQACANPVCGYAGGHASLMFIHLDRFLQNFTQIMKMLSLLLLVLSADNLCKQFGSRAGPTFVGPSCSESKLYDAQMVFMK